MTETEIINIFGTVTDNSCRISKWYIYTLDSSGNEWFPVSSDALYSATL